MTRTHAFRLLEYDHWCNRRLFDVYSNSIDFQSKAVTSIFSHLLGAKEVWLNRIQEEAAPRSLLDERSLDELVLLDSQLHQAWLKVLKNQPADLGFQSVSYENFSGQLHTSSFNDILTHIVNHGSYHRGQIAQSMRASGLIPPATDFIVFSRQ